MLDIEQIHAAEPRLQRIEQIAVNAVLDGANIDGVYRDAKPFVCALVGWRRGLAVAMTNLSPLQHRFARVVADVTRESRVILTDSQSYEVVVDDLYRKLANL